MKHDKKALTIRKKLNHREKEFMLAHLIRLPIMFSQAKSLLKPEHFTFEDAMYADVWEAALKLADKNGGLLPAQGLHPQLELETKNLTEADSRVTENMEEELFRPDSGLFTWMFDELKQEDLTETAGSALLAEFLEETLVITPLRTATAELGDNIPKDVGGFIRNLLDNYGKIRSVGADPVIDPFPMCITQHGVGIHPTGITFLDEFMGGGQAPGETYTVMGPSGVGKTTLGVQIAVRGSLQQLTMHGLDPTYEPGHWYYFIYEFAADPEIYFRVWSCSAEIHRDSLWKEFAPDLSSLSRSNNMKVYELQKYGDQIKQGLKMPGEYERFVRAREQYQNILHVVDMSGFDKNNPKAGSGWIDEVASVLARESDKGRKIAGFVLDDADTLTDRYIGENDIDPNNKTMLLNRLVMDVNRLCSGPFNTSGWVFHQLAGAVNSRAPTKVMHHSDGAYCKSFPKNAWFAFNLGTKDPETSTCILSCSKSRRASSAGTSKIIHIDGEYCRMLPAEGKYTIDAHTKKIISNSSSDIIKPRSKRLINPVAVL